MIRATKDLTLLIDGAIFQLQKGKSGGISNVWRNLFDEIEKDNQFKRVVVLDRGHAPKLKSIEVVPYPEFDKTKYNDETPGLDEACQKYGANLFISTHFTAPKSVYSIGYIHDFIPERMGMNLNDPAWVYKMHMLDQVQGYIGVSKTTLEDLHHLHPRYDSKPRSIVYNAISEDFKVYPQSEVEAVKQKFGINKKYFVLLGFRVGYKNTVTFFKAFRELNNKDDYQIVCVGGYPQIEHSLSFHVKPFQDIVIISATNPELSALLNDAQALVYPSVCEGFGMPILESWSSECPIIISKQAAACLEVAGKGALVVDGFNVAEMAQALVEVQKPEVCESILKVGRASFGKFSRENFIQQFYKAMDDNLAGMNAFYGAGK